MAQLKISRTMASQAERCGIRIETLEVVGPGAGSHFDFYRQDLDVFVGRAWKPSEASAFFRGWLAAGGIVDAPDPREAASSR